MENILQYIWQKRLLTKREFSGTRGERICIVSPGTNDVYRSELFREAKVEIDDKTWCGNVILLTGREAQQPGIINEEGVILYVTLNEEHCIATDDNTSRLCIECPEELSSEYEKAKSHSDRFPCSEIAARIPTIEWHGILSRLLSERLTDKREIIERIFRQCDQRWDDTLLKTTIRSFGFGIQSDVFDEWAAVLDTQAIGKHCDNQTQVEAIFFGQAGLLNDESIPYYYSEEARRSSYYNELKKEYRFLSNKFGLKNISHRLWNCGNATPHLRIARLAALYCSRKITISGITSTDTLKELYGLFNHPLEGYWQNHTCFGGTETCGNGDLKQRQADVIIINSVVPLLYIYGKHRKDEKLCERAEDLLHQIAGEENSIIRRWREQGITVDCAADSQALLQLNRKYCRANNCTECSIAYHYIKNRLEKK